MTNKVLKTKLKKLGACLEAIEWLGGRDLEAAWAECERGNWMLWLAGHANVDRRLLVKAACKCAELALPIYEKKYPEDNRARNCIKVALQWVAGKATIEQVRNAAYAAADAGDAAAYAAAYAANAAAYAANAAADAAYAAYAADAAADAGDAAAYAAADAARVKMHKQTARKIRRVIPYSVIVKALR